MKIIKEAVEKPLENLVEEATHEFEEVRDTADTYVHKLSNEKEPENYLPLTKEALNSIDTILDRIDKIISEMEKN